MHKVQLSGERIVFVVQDLEVQAMLLDRLATVFGQLRRNGVKARIGGNVLIQVFVKSYQLYHTVWSPAATKERQN